MGFCLFNNVAVTAAALADARRAGADRRLRRPPRQRHPGRVLGRRPGGLRQLPPVPALPRHRRPARGRRRRRARAPPSTCRCRRAPPATRSAPGSTRSSPRSRRRSSPPGCSSRPGFDAHRADPITDLGLSAGDYADLTAALLALVPPGRRIVFLEGGYDLDALAASAAACVGALVGERIVPEPPTGGGPGRDAITAAALVRAELRRRRAERHRYRMPAPEADVGRMTQLEELLSYLHEIRGSDLHLKPGAVPHVRVDGQLKATPFEVPAPGVVEALRREHPRRRPPERPRHHRRGQLRVQRRRPRPLPRRHPPPARLARHGRAPGPAGDPRPRRARPAAAGGALHRGGEAAWCW